MLAGSFDRQKRSRSQAPKDDDHGFMEKLTGSASQRMSVLGRKSFFFQCPRALAPEGVTIEWSPVAKRLATE